MWKKLSWAAQVQERQEAGSHRMKRMHAMLSPNQINPILKIYLPFLLKNRLVY